MSSQVVAARAPAEGDEARRFTPSGYVPWILAAASFAAYTTYSVRQFRLLVNPSWDLSIFTQVVANYAHLRAPVADLKGPGFNILGDHFSPILALLAPFYRLFPTPLTLEVAQAALFAVAVVPITRLAWRRLGWQAGLAIGLAYSCAWGIQIAVVADFHEIAFAVPMLAFSLVALVEQRWVRAAVWAIPLVLVKEDLGLTVAMIGLYLVLQRQRKLGWSLVVGGVAATVITVTVIIPAFNAAHTYAYLGAGISGGQSSLGDSVKNLLWPAPKLYTVLLLVAASGIISLRSPLVLICVPTLLWRFESGNPSYWTPRASHYSAVLMPIIFVALIDAAIRLRGSPRLWLRASGRFGPAAALAAAVVCFTQYPLHAVLSSGTYQAAPRAGLKALSFVPNGTTVEVDNGLIAQLVTHDTLYWRGDSGAFGADYMVLDVYAGYPKPLTRPLQYAESLHPGESYRVLYRGSPYVVLERVSPGRS